MKPLAAIDIGTNTFRLLIAEVQPKVYKKNDYNIKEIYSERIITRLGQGISENGLIKKSAIHRGLSALKKFHDVILHYNVYETSAIATSALREAKNKGEFLRRAKETTGLEIKIISGREEAKKTFSGMLIGITMPETALMVDIGGGSTELIFTPLEKKLHPRPVRYLSLNGASFLTGFTRQRKPLLVHSLNLGVVYLADKHMKKDPPLMKDLNRMGNEISQKIMLIVKLFAKLFSKNTAFIGTAGTVTALAAITQNLTKYEHSKIHNSKITIEKVRGIFSNISTITAKERAKYYALEPARLNIIVPGTLILLKLMETFGFKEVIVSDYGLREGIILDLYRGNRK